MFLVKISYFIFLLFPTLLFSQGKFKIINSKESKLPILLNYKGDIKDNVHWIDDSGEHTVIVCETGKINKKEAYEMESYDAELYAYKFDKKDTQITQDWKIQDFVRDCPFDITATFVNNTLQVTDLDKDGIGEVWVMYKVTCRSDVSPCDMKIIMYEGQTKHAMRGQNKVPATETTFFGGEYKFDEAFENGPKSFLDFALKLWNENIIESWEK